MYKKILVATDGSEYSNHALQTAVHFAERFDSEIRLLHVISQPRTYGTFTGMATTELTNEQVDEMGQQVFGATLAGIDIGNVSVSKKTVIGNPAVEILAEINSGIDILVMGSRGHGPFLGAITGSVTQRVLAHAPCPIVVVK